MNFWSNFSFLPRRFHSFRLGSFALPPHFPSINKVNYSGSKGWTFSLTRSFSRGGSSVRIFFRLPSLFTQNIFEMYRSRMSARVDFETISTTSRKVISKLLKENSCPTRHFVCNDFHCIITYCRLVQLSPLLPKDLLVIDIGHHALNDLIRTLWKYKRWFKDFWGPASKVARKQATF